MTRIITIADSIKQEIAERVAKQASAGYATDYQGQWYVVDGTSVQHKQANARWSPWHDDSVDKTQMVAVQSLITRIV